MALEARLHLARSFVTHLVQMENCTDSLSTLYSRFQQNLRTYGIHNISMLTSYLEDSTKIFFVDGNTVSLTSDLFLCPSHSQKSGSCPENDLCAGLHICLFFVLSGRCNFRSKCHFGHDLMTTHNLQVLEEHGLAHLDISHLRVILSIPSVRTRVTRPRVCRFYNRKDGCKKGKSCRSLHLCKFYVFGDCKFAAKCRRNHNIFNPEVTKVLELYSVNTARQPKDILEELYQYAKTDEEEDDYLNDNDDDQDDYKVEDYDDQGSDNSNDEDSSHEQGAYSLRQPRHMSRSTPNLFLQSRRNQSKSAGQNRKQRSSSRPRKNSNRDSPVLKTDSDTAGAIQNRYSKPRDENRHANNSHLLPETQDRRRSGSAQVENHFSLVDGLKMRSLQDSVAITSKKSAKKQTAILKTTAPVRAHTTDVTVTKLSPSSPEYKEMAEKFMERINQPAVILKIESIVNQRSLEEYEKQKAIMNSQRVDSQSVRAYFLYYGPSPNETSDSICKEGIRCERQLSYHDAPLGNGAYLYATAAGADETNGTLKDRRVFVVGCLVGEYGQGNPGIRRTPIMHSNRRYDSCVDDVENPQVFVIFEKAQIDVKFLITYKLVSFDVGKF